MLSPDKSALVTALNSEQHFDYDVENRILPAVLLDYGQLIGPPDGHSYPATFQDYASLPRIRHSKKKEGTFTSMNSGRIDIAFSSKEPTE